MEMWRLDWELRMCWAPDRIGERRCGPVSECFSIWGKVLSAESRVTFLTPRTKLIQPAAIPLSPQDALPPSFSLNPPVNNLLVADPHLKLPKSYQWTVAVDQSLGDSQTFSLTYIGTVGRNQLRSDSLLNPNPSFHLSW
jgi:hypothetical protein